MRKVEPEHGSVRTRALARYPGSEAATGDPSTVHGDIEPRRHRCLRQRPPPARRRRLPIHMSTPGPSWRAGPVTHPHRSSPHASRSGQADPGPDVVSRPPANNRSTPTEHRRPQRRRTRTGCGQPIRSWRDSTWRGPTRPARMRCRRRAIPPSSGFNRDAPVLICDAPRPARVLSDTTRTPGRARAGSADPVGGCVSVGPVELCCR